ncbi:thiol-disulfide oxidoreductase [Actinoplanes sp. SE50]|uniref:redoxin family protein n=1 Tax=unclassified Actinoplanes TaxID=2626549 RepID=UPI00023EBBEC|nr:MULTISPECIES: redoxin family protein [unclassified Actinoplanes]AEV86227.1 Thiol-disulfide oxidoreductase resA [Actinoplanes sp. SE50/110]ATO84625.1 thiol-disulfide oxidoreductase [Actinoplanes sp. SE50]SLM02035.1 thiol-disulfide oxidoreductase [Actinoplanes sp. SE50/110]
MSTRRALLTLPFAMLAAGCAAAPEAATPAAAAGRGSGSAAAPAVPDTLRFSGTTLDGTKFDAAQLAGRPAVLWFWAPWCATCASEAQSVADFHDEYAGRLTFLGIAGLGTAKAMRQFVADLDVGKVTHLNDPSGTIWSKFGIAQQSTYVLLDAAGKIVTRGYLDDLQLTAALKKLAG